MGRLRLRDPEEPSLSPVDHGVTVGDGAFETAKVVGGQAFALTRHARRLDRSLAGLGLPGADHAQLTEGIAAVLGAGEPIDSDVCAARSPPGRRLSGRTARNRLGSPASSPRPTSPARRSPAPS